MTIAINITNDNDWEKVAYIGPINEEAEVHLAKIVGSLGPKVRISFQQVTMVNSCGVRSWVNFMRELCKGRTVEFVDCTSEIVMQINMIPSFRGDAKIISVMGSYSCDGCGAQKSVLFEQGKNMPKNDSDPVEAPVCSQCGETMEMEELEEEFFAFVAA